MAVGPPPHIGRAFAFFFVSNMLTFGTEKLWTTAVLWLMTLTSTFIPLFIHKKFRLGPVAIIMSFCNCLAGGVILGTMLLHVLPTLFEPENFMTMMNVNPNPTNNNNLESVGISTYHEIVGFRYPLGCLFAGLSFLLLFAVDRLFLSKNHPHHHHHDISLSEPTDACHHPSQQHQPQPHGTGVDPPDLLAPVSSSSADLEAEKRRRESISAEKQHHAPLKAQAVVFVLALSLHSFLEGLGLCAISNRPELISFIISLLSHKWLEAFALGATVYNAKFSRKAMFSLNFFYSALTPVGILFGMLLVDSYESTYFQALISMIFNGLSVGSFLFVCCVEMVPAEFEVVDKYTWWKFLTLFLGFAAMSLLALLE